MALQKGKGNENVEENYEGGGIIFETGFHLKIAADLSNKAGPPLKQGTLTRIFEPFTQADSSLNRKYGGTGPGLSICERLTKLLGGKIGVRSTLREGSCFWIEIPFDVQSVPEKTALSSSDKTISEVKIKAESTPCFDILVVDDDKPNQRLMNALLTHAAHNVHSVDRGLLALDLLEKNDYHLILMDVQMPELDGYETTKRIRALDNKKSDVPIIGVSAHAMLRKEESSIETGMNSYITKPINSEELLSLISQWGNYDTTKLN